MILAGDSAPPRPRYNSTSKCTLKSAGFVPNGIFFVEFKEEAPDSAFYLK
jgi:hypothetical protein